MEEIKFRGLDNNGNWFIGSHLKTGTGMHYIVPQNVIGSLPQYSVRAETVGQYSGLVDIKGNQIYNADLIKDDENFIWEVCYKQGTFYAKCDDLLALQILSTVNLYGVVVGNIHEHPNLIGA